MTKGKDGSTHSLLTWPRCGCPHPARCPHRPVGAWWWWRVDGDPARGEGAMVLRRGASAPLPDPPPGVEPQAGAAEEKTVPSPLLPKR